MRVPVTGHRELDAALVRAVVLAHGVSARASTAARRARWAVHDASARPGMVGAAARWARAKKRVLLSTWRQRKTQ